ncbi:hypothetical protein J6590_103471 [Homalodisca vitripennis]|nr:hypothetical protein J6590_103471 [Homalodisca vitripennis]
MATKVKAAFENAATFPEAWTVRNVIEHGRVVDLRGIELSTATLVFPNHPLRPPPHGMLTPGGDYQLSG